MNSGVRGSQSRFTVFVAAVATFLAFAPPTAAQEARVRVAVLNFDTYLIEQAEWPYPWAASGLGPLATSLLTSELASHRRFTVIERRYIDEILKEQDLGTSSRVNASTAAQLGQLLGAQVVVVGDVQEFGKKTVGGIGGLARRGLIGGRQEKLSIVLGARMIDAATGEILATSEGKADVSEGALGLLTASAGVIVGTELEGEASKVLREAIVDLAKNMVDRAEDFDIAPMIPCLTGSVATVAGGRVYLAMGASTSISVGDYFKIRDRQEAILDPATGDTLGFVEADKGFVRVAEVQERMSIADVVEGSGFARGQAAVRSAAPGDDTQCVHIRGAAPDPEPERAAPSAGAEPARVLNAAAPPPAAAAPPPAAAAPAPARVVAPPPSGVAVPPSTEAVAAGGAHSCEVTTGGTVHCWGDNSSGSLGNGTNTESTAPVAVSGALTFQSVTAGLAYSCGVTTAGDAYCWGDNSAGTLGNGSLTSTNVPVAVFGGFTFASVTAGSYHSCGVTTAGAAYCWGDNRFGQLGDGTRTTSVVPIAISGGLTFQSVTAAFYHSCGVTTAGAAYCWGSSTSAQLGDGTSTLGNPVPVPVSGGLTFQSVTAALTHSCGLTTAGAAYCWGNNTFGQLGNGTFTVGLVPVPVSGGLTFESLTAGHSHSCGVTTAGAAYCWGNNGLGRLGNGTMTASNVPAAVSGGLTFQSVTISPGMMGGSSAHTCGATTDGDRYCWGSNGSGQLGDGTKTDRNVPVLVGPSIGTSATQRRPAVAAPPPTAAVADARPARARNALPSASDESPIGDWHLDSEETMQFWQRMLVATVPMFQSLTDEEFREALGPYWDPWRESIDAIAMRLSIAEDGTFHIALRDPGTQTLSTVDGTWRKEGILFVLSGTHIDGIEVNEVREEYIKVGGGRLFGQDPQMTDDTAVMGMSAWQVRWPNLSGGAFVRTAR